MSYKFPRESTASPKAMSNVWSRQVGGRDVAKANPALHTSQLPVRTVWVNIGFPSLSASQLANAWCMWPKQLSEKKLWLFRSDTQISDSRHERYGVGFSLRSPAVPFCVLPTAEARNRTPQSPYQTPLAPGHYAEPARGEKVQCHSLAAPVIPRQQRRQRPRRNMNLQPSDVKSTIS